MFRQIDPAVKDKYCIPVQTLSDFFVQEYKTLPGYSAMEALYITTDHPRVNAARVFDIAESFEKLGGKLLVIDEIHKQSGFSTDYIQDFFKRVYQFVSGIGTTRTGIGLSFRTFLETLPIRADWIRPIPLLPITSMS